MPKKSKKKMQHVSMYIVIAKINFFFCYFVIVATQFDTCFTSMQVCRNLCYIISKQTLVPEIMPLPLLLSTLISSDCCGRLKIFIPPFTWLKQTRQSTPSQQTWLPFEETISEASIPNDVFVLSHPSQLFPPIIPICLIISKRQKTFSTHHHILTKENFLKK